MTLQIAKKKCNVLLRNKAGLSKGKSHPTKEAATDASVNIIFKLFLS